MQKGQKLSFLALSLTCAVGCALGANPAIFSCGHLLVSREGAWDI